MPEDLNHTSPENRQEPPRFPPWPRGTNTRTSVFRQSYQPALSKRS